MPVFIATLLPSDVVEVASVEDREVVLKIGSSSWFSLHSEDSGSCRLRYIAVTSLFGTAEGGILSNEGASIISTFWWASWLPRSALAIIDRLSRSVTCSTK